LGYFTLRRSTPNPDARTWPIIGTGTKQSFCLVNLGDCTSDYGFCINANGDSLTQANIPNSGFGSVTGCSIDQGIYVGNLDIYTSGLNSPGIVLPLNTCNGDYYIVSITDFNNNFLESDDNNNWTAVPITLTLQTPGNFPLSGFTFNGTGNTRNFTSNASSVDSCVWMWGDASPNTTTMGLNASHTFPGSGTYVVFLYAYNQCGPTVSADTVTIINLGINQLVQTVAAFNVFPNPVQDKAAIEYSLVNEANVTLEVFDAVGNRIKSLINTQIPGKYRITLDARADNLSAGVYIVRLTSGNTELNKRITIMR